MDIILKNCNSIESGKISIIEGSLNIKYAINGTGKTTISKAIVSYIRDRDNSSKSLMDLKPFKFRDGKNTNNPIIEGVDSLKQVAIFNESYIEQFVFLPDELLKDSFEIFIIDEKYEKGMKQINDLIKVIGETFRENEDLEELLKDLNDLNACFGKSKKISKASSIVKGMEIGNKVANIPKELTVYSDFIQHPENVKWLKWQMNGSNYLEISTACPYCTSDIEEKKDTILAVKKEYDSNLIEHLNKVIGVVQRLSAYFTENTYEKILKISQSVDGLKEEYEEYLMEIRSQIGLLIDKLNKVKYLNFQTLKDFEKVQEVINDYKIELEYISHLNSTGTSEKVDTINASLDEILKEAGRLQGEVNKQKIHIEKTILEYNREINNFLKNAGYSYHVNIEEDENQTYRLKLKHNDFLEDNVDNAKLHLSFGERNAFALVLFMFETIKNSPDMVILDDPISSFDKNKKYAIIDMLFRGKKSLRGKTVLMLTHDFEPIVDMVYHHTDRFEAGASFLENIKGNLSEKIIEKKDVKTFFEIAEENIFNLDEDINKLIYLRRFLEIQNDKSEAYQLLSNLFHKRQEPIIRANKSEIKMTTEEVNKGSKIIAERINGFEYKKYYEMVSDTEYLISLYEGASNNYEKLQIYRTIIVENSDNAVIRKFVNETYHIENDYLYQLNPCEYEVVPQYIIDECNKDIEQLKGAVQNA